MDETIRYILTRFRRIAVVGMSRNAEKAAHRVPMYLRSQGYTIYPVNPFVQEIQGLRVFPELASINDPVEVVEIFRPADRVVPVVMEAIRRAEERGDVQAVWLQEGIRSEKARELAEHAGLLYVEDRCMLVEHLRLHQGTS